MLKFITDITDTLLDYIKDDPVRPEISREFRVSTNRFVSVLLQQAPEAMVCVSLQDSVPATVQDLLDDVSQRPTVAIFYTIWSYRSGAGAELLLETVSQIKQLFPQITRFVTLSPKTEMAHRFHMRNGASMLRNNHDTVNYEYKFA